MKDIYVLTLTALLPFAFGRSAQAGEESRAGSITAASTVSFQLPGDGESKADGINSSFSGTPYRCNVVLRTAKGEWPRGGPEGKTYTGTFDVSQQSLVAGGTPKVWAAAQSNHHPERSNQTVEATPTDGAAEGYQRYSFTFLGADSGELSTTSAATYSVSFLPFVEFPNGSRLYDHNRSYVASVNTNYVLQYRLNLDEIEADDTCH